MPSSDRRDEAGPSTPPSPIGELPPIPSKLVRQGSRRDRNAGTPSSFAPLTHTSSRISTRSASTFVEAAAVVAAADHLVEPARIRRVSEHADEASAAEEGETKEVAVEEVANGELEYPDGGRDAWLTVLGGIFALFCGFGLTAALGGFQTYYRSNLLSNYQSGTIAWITGSQAFVTFFLTAFTGSLFDKYGHKPLMFFGTLLSTFGLMMLSLCHEYWQLILVHIVLIAVGNNLIFISPMGVIGQWFYLRRGLAFGLLSIPMDFTADAVSGASTGSIIWPLILANLPQRIGFPWTCRVMGFITLVLGSGSYILMKTRLPPKPPGPFFYFAAFKNIAYCCIAASSFTYVFAFFSFLTFIGTYGEVVGLGHFASYLLIICNAASLFGRLSLGLTADVIGPWNVTSISIAIMTLLYWLWITFKTATSLIVFTILFGFWSGAYVAVQAPMIVSSATDMRYAGTMIGQVMFFQSFSQLAGPPAFGTLLGDGSLQEQAAAAPRAISLGAGMMTATLLFMLLGRFSMQRALRVKV